MPIPSFDDIMDFDPNNRENFNALIEQVRTKKLVPFVGSGMSAFCFPIWSDFMSEQFSRHLPGIQMPDNLLDAEWYFTDRLGSKDFLSDIANAYDNGADLMSVGKNAADQAVALLPELFSGMVVTTNHDRVLEHVYGTANVAHCGKLDPLIRFNLEGGQLVFKLFGTIEDPSSLVVRREDYLTCVNRLTELEGMPKAALMGAGFLFLGCSLEHDPLIGLWQGLAGTQTASKAEHFAILAANPAANPGNLQERRRELSGMNIRTVFYNSEGGDHSAVRTLLECLYSGVYGKPYSAPSFAPKTAHGNDPEQAFPDESKNMQDQALRETAEFLEALARNHIESAEYADALECLEKALDIRENELGRSSPDFDMAESYYKTAQAHLADEEYDLAMEWHMKAFVLLEKTPGQNDPQTACSCDGIALSHFGKGEYDDALDWHRKALAIRAKSLGVDHLDYAISCFNIGDVHFAKSEFDTALEWFERSLAIREKELGTGHPDTAGSIDSIALAYMSLGKDESALQWHMKALAIREKTFGSDQAETAESYGYIADVYSAKGDTTTALEWHRKALSVLEKSLGTDSPLVAESCSSIAEVYASEGSHTLALKWHKRALATYEKSLGPDNPLVAEACNNIADVYGDRGDLKSATQWQRKALAIYEKSLGPNHPVTAECYNSLAVILSAAGNYDMALEFHMKAIDILEKRLGTDSPETASAYAAIAMTCFGMGDDGAALEWQAKGIASLEKALGTAHQMSAHAYTMMATMQGTIGNFDESLEWYAKAIRAFRLNGEYLEAESLFLEMSRAYEGSSHAEPFETWAKRKLEMQ